MSIKGGSLDENRKQDKRGKDYPLINKLIEIDSQRLVLIIQEVVLYHSNLNKDQ